MASAPTAMTTTARHPLVEDYLRRLRTESARLPTDQARELLADIDEHSTPRSA